MAIHSFRVARPNSLLTNVNMCSSYSYRLLTAADEPVVWRMLYEAARLARKMGTSPMKQIQGTRF